MTETSAQAGGPGGAEPQTPAALEQAIQRRRDHLAATIDELTVRANPKEIARRGAAEVGDRLRSTVRTPEGELRTERVAAVGAALAVLGGLLVLVRLRRRR